VSCFLFLPLLHCSLCGVSGLFVAESVGVLLLQGGGVPESVCVLLSVRACV